MRIIAGLHKGRSLLPPPGKSITRPITGSVKKSLFAMLGEDLSGQVILDLFCGTGTMGIEAISRGAKFCYFAERDPSVIERLVRNLRDIGIADQGTVWRGDVFALLAKWLAPVNAAFDVVFVDPPYAMAREWDWAETNEAIFQPAAAKLAPEGVIVLRTDDSIVIPKNIGNLEVTRTRKYGTMVVTMLMKTEGLTAEATKNAENDVNNQKD